VFLCGIAVSAAILVWASKLEQIRVAHEAAAKSTATQPAPVFKQEGFKDLGIATMLRQKAEAKKRHAKLAAKKHA
jgi:hypothetical protein